MLETEKGGATQGQSGRPSPASAQSRDQTKAQAQPMAQPASLSQEATSCGAKSTGVSGGLGPDPVPPQDGRGSDPGQLPSFLRPPLPHFYCSRLGSKGSVQPRPLGISHCSPYLLLPELPEGGAASPRSPQGDYLTITAKAWEGATPPAL